MISPEMWSDFRLATANAGSFLKGSDMAESYCHLLSGDTISIRPYPFPYRAALAVSNDCDSMTVQSFWDWHGFVNGDGPTAYGDGLSLEVGDSFWIYAGIGHEPALSFTNPYDDEVKEYTKWMDTLELGKLGWFDTLHSVGNWRVLNQPGQMGRMDRSQIERGLELLDTRGLKPFVFTNHSGSPSNIGGPWGYYQKADDPESPLYCLDLLREFGFKYFWIDPCVHFDKFGDEIRYFTQDEFDRSVVSYAFGPWLRRKGLDGLPETISLPSNEDELRSLLLAMFNRIVLPVKGRDGTKILAFKRHRGLDQPLESTFCTQVTESNLDDLENRGGCVIVYQHFAIQGPRGRAPTRSKPLRIYAPIPALDRHSVERFRSISDRNQKGDLFVATVGRLLNWINVRDSVVFKVDKTETRWVVTLLHIDCATYGKRELLDQDLNGISFVVPASAPDVIVRREGFHSSLPLHRKPDPVHAGFDCVFSHWEKLEWPSVKK